MAIGSPSAGPVLRACTRRRRTAATSSPGIEPWRAEPWRSRTAAAHRQPQRHRRWPAPVVRVPTGRPPWGRRPPGGLAGQPRQPARTGFPEVVAEATARARGASDGALRGNPWTLTHLGAAKAPPELVPCDGDRPPTAGCAPSRCSERTAAERPPVSPSVNNLGTPLLV